MAELLPGVGSDVELETVAVFVIVEPPAVPEFTLTTSVKTWGELGASVGMVAVIVPVPPTDGVVGVQPPGATSDTNGVFVGTVSGSETDDAESGPLFVTVIV